MSEWIDVKDRSPEESQRCIVWVECEKCRNKVLHAHDCLERGYDVYDSTTMMWVGGGWNCPEANVTHWMPLPEVPT